MLKMIQLTYGIYIVIRLVQINIMKKTKMTAKRKELINNLSQTISKESKRVTGSDKQLIDKLKKILDKVKS